MVNSIRTSSRDAWKLHETRNVAIIHQQHNVLHFYQIVFPVYYVFFFSSGFTLAFHVHLGIDCWYFSSPFGNFPEIFLLLLYDGSRLDLLDPSNSFEVYTICVLIWWSGPFVEEIYREELGTLMK